MISAAARYIALAVAAVICFAVCLLVAAVCGDEGKRRRA